MQTLAIIAIAALCGFMLGYTWCDVKHARKELRDTLARVSRSAGTEP